MNNIPSASTFFNQFWGQSMPSGQLWTVALINAVYGYDLSTLQQLWNWAQNQTPGMSAAQLLALFNSTEQEIATPMGEEIEPIPLPQPSTAALGTISEQQFFADLQAFLHKIAPALFP